MKMYKKICIGIIFCSLLMILLISLLAGEEPAKPAQAAPITERASADSPPQIARPATLTISVPETLPPEKRELVSQAWPRVKQACPGLDRYASSLHFKEVEQNYRTTIVFDIPESDTGIPAGFVAQGHACYFEVSKDGRRLVVAKNACQKLCLDREMDESDSPLTLYLTGVTTDPAKPVNPDESPIEAALRVASAVCTGNVAELEKSVQMVPTVVGDVTPYQLLDALATIFENGTKKRKCDMTLGLYVYGRTVLNDSHAETVETLRKMAVAGGPVDGPSPKLGKLQSSK